MSNNIITRREANQLNRAFVKTGGKFDTVASRILTERLSAKVAAASQESAKYTSEDTKLAAAMAFKDGVIKRAVEKENRLYPYALCYGTDKNYSLNFSDWEGHNWNYSIVSPWKALKTSFSIRNFFDTLQESRQEKTRLAREAETAISGSLHVAQDSRVRIAKDKAHKERLGQR